MSGWSWLITTGLAGGAVLVRPLCDWRIYRAQARCVIRSAEIDTKFAALEEGM